MHYGETKMPQDCCEWNILSSVEPQESFLESHIIHLPISYKRWKATKIGWLQFCYICIYFASQKYTVIILKDLQYTYNTLKIQNNLFL